MLYFRTLSTLCKINAGWSFDDQSTTKLQIELTNNNKNTKAHESKKNFNNVLQTIYQATGRVYKVGTFRGIIYYAAGTSLDWSYGSAKIPFSCLIELRKEEKHSVIPENQILDTCKEATAYEIYK